MFKWRVDQKFGQLPRPPRQEQTPGSNAYEQVFLRDAATQAECIGNFHLCKGQYMRDIPKVAVEEGTIDLLRQAERQDREKLTYFKGFTNEGRR